MLASPPEPSPSKSSAAPAPAPPPPPSSSTRFDLVRVVLELSTRRTLDGVVQVLRDATRDLTGADGISVVLRDDDQCYYVEENAVGPLWKGRRFPLTACISGWCMLNRRQVVIEDIYADARIPHDAYRPTFVKSLAMTPIRTAAPVGAIGAYWASRHRATPEQLGVLQALGDSAALALENGQLIDELRETARRKDAFLSMLAHELRNPLAPIRNGLHLLRLQGGRPDAVADAVGIMDRQVVHMSRIVDDLLDVARIGNGKVTLRRARLDLGALVRQCAEDRRMALREAGLSLDLDVPLAPLWANADATRFTQALGNLLDNARKYTPAGGRVGVSVAANAAAGSATVEVRDTGVGIPAALLPRLFESFTQADESLDRTAGGLGLGLSIARGLVALHGGTVAAHSDGVGRGARFAVTLPDVEPERLVAPADGPAAPRAADAALRLLIIEDNRDTADTLQKILKMCGYGASVAYDGTAGVDLAEAERPDVVLCDIGLPKMDGFAVAAALRRSERTSAARLIAVTGYGSDEDRRRAKAAGFDAHLVKPIDLEALLGALRAPVAA